MPLQGNATPGLAVCCFVYAVASITWKQMGTSLAHGDDQGTRTLLS